MSTVTKFPSANNGGWDDNETYAYADDGSYTTEAPGVNSTTYLELGNFGFDGEIPAGSTINSVTLNAQWKVSTTASSATFRLAGLISNVVEGTEHTDTSEPTSDKTTNFAMTSLPTRDELLDGVFEVRVGAQRGAGATGYTMSLDYVSVTVDYTAVTSFSPSLSPSQSPSASPSLSPSASPSVEPTYGEDFTSPGMSVTQSSYYNTDYLGNNAIDNIDGSGAGERWQTANYPTYPTWIRIDLGSGVTKTARNS